MHGLPNLKICYPQSAETMQAKYMKDTVLDILTHNAAKGDSALISVAN